MKKIVLHALFTSSLLFLSCDKSGEAGSGTEVELQPQVDPEVAATTGFFLDTWTPKTYTSPVAFTEGNVPTTTSSTVTIDYAKVLTKIPASIYGNNANLWSGKMVTDNLLTDNITKLKPNIIRFPGGSISDVYFWNAASNPPNVPPTLRNAEGQDEPAGFWFGQNNADWTMSLDNYYQLLTQTNSKGIITVNAGYARYGTGTNPVADAAQLAADWVTYDNGRTQYWEIGNENFGSWEAGYRIDTSRNQDGQPEFHNGALYAAHFKVIAAAMRAAAAASGHSIKIGAVLFDAPAESWMNDTNKFWNDQLLGALGEEADYYVVHNYFTASENLNATQILDTPTAKVGTMVAFLKGQLTNHTHQIKPFALDEWNIFARGSKQQVSHVNGLHAVLLLGEALKNNIGLAARWDFFNGWDNGNDHGIFSNGDEPNIPKGTARPAFYHMYFFQKNMGDRLIEAVKDANGNYEVYASSFSDGKIGVTFVNKGTTALPVKLAFKNFIPGNRMYWYTITGDTDNGEFSRKVQVNGNGTTLEAGGPANYTSIRPFSAKTTDGTAVVLPARSSVFVIIETKN